MKYNFVYKITMQYKIQNYTYVILIHLYSSYTLHFCNAAWLEEFTLFFFFFFRKIFVIPNREDSHARRWTDRVESGGVGQSHMHTTDRVSQLSVHILHFNLFEAHSLHHDFGGSALIHTVSSSFLGPGKNIDAYHCSVWYTGRVGSTLY